MPWLSGGTVCRPAEGYWHQTWELFVSRKHRAGSTQPAALWFLRAKVQLYSSFAQIKLIAHGLSGRVWLEVLVITAPGAPCGSLRALSLCQGSWCTASSNCHVVQVRRGLLWWVDLSEQCCTTALISPPLPSPLHPKSYWWMKQILVTFRPGIFNLIHLLLSKELTDFHLMI